MHADLRFFVLLPVFVILLIPASLFCDTPAKVDSLKKQLVHANDAEKLSLYIELIKSIRNIAPAEGINFAKEALALPETQKSEVLKAKLLNEQGVCYRKLNIPEKALKLHFEALQIFEKRFDSTGMAYTLADIGSVYHSLNDYENALDFHFKSLFLKEYLHDEPQIAYSQNAIGMVHSDMKDYRRALDFFISAMAIRKKYDQKLELANVYSNIGKVMIRLARPDDAYDYLQRALNQYNETNNEFGQASVLNQMADLLVTENKLKEALEKLEKAEQIAKRLQSNTLLHFNYKLQKEIYRRQGNFEKAIGYADRTSQLKDTLYNERRRYEISELHVRYETQKLDNENEILRLKLKEQYYQTRYLVVVSVLFVIVIVGFYLFKGYNRKQKYNRNLEKLNLELEKRVEERTEQLNNEVREKQLAYNSLKQSQEHLKAIHETSPFGIAVTNGEGKITTINQRLTEATGIPGKEFLDSSWLRHILQEDRKTIEMFWQNAHKYEGALPDLLFRLRDQSQYRWIHLKGAPMKDENQFLGLVIVMENITEAKKFEQDLIKAKNKAEESDLLKSAFLANMSHEIRTPMNAILGFSDLLAADDYTNEEKSDFVEMIRSSGKMLLNLINDIIDISKIEAGELKIQHTTFRIDSLLEELFQTFRQQLDQNGKSGVRLILSGRDEAKNLEITTDKMRLMQIFTNLLSNATKFTQSGQIEFGMIKTGDKLQFFVKDSGIGIPETKLDVIFERFRQADDSHTRVFGGTGLGLAITRNLTQLLGGAIWVESVEGKGSVFYFTLPAPETSTQSMRPYPDMSSKTILVAEDVETNFTLLNGMLKHTKTKVYHATNGLIAVHMANELKPDLIFMDIQMPEKDGIQAMKEIKSVFPRVPVIAISAFALSEEGQKFIQMGFDSYLSKPLSLEKVIGSTELFLNN